MRHLIPTRWSICIAYALLAFSHCVNAQIPGHWALAYRAPHWVFMGMEFHDSGKGVLILDFGTSASLTTSDAGANWLLTKDSGMILDPLDLHAIDMPTDSDVYVLSSVSANYSSNGGVSWKQYQLAIPPTGPPSSWRIFPRGVGRAITYADQYMIWNCSDSAKYFHDVQPKSLDWISYDSVRDAIILDTNQFWVSNAAGQMLQTVDGGKTWKWITVYPGLDTLHSLAWIATTPDPSRFYVTIDRGPIPRNGNGQWDSTVQCPPLSADFIETTDDGASWRIDSSLGTPRIYELCSPGGGKLWAFTGERPSFYFTSNIGPSLVWPSHAFFADTLLYSPDDGGHWFSDTTFLGDTLMQMCWPDSAHGYIAAVRGDTLLVYRFIADFSSVSTITSIGSEISISPNPAVRSITITGAPAGRLHFLDGLGRPVLTNKVPGGRTLSFGISQLPPGCYILVFQAANGGIAERKLLVR